MIICLAEIIKVYFRITNPWKGKLFMSTNYKIVRDAVSNKQIIKAKYDGYEREMCPHIIGKNREGRDHVFVYQFGGYSSKGKIIPNSKSNWRCIQIDKLENIRVEEGKWHTFDNHSKAQVCVVHIDLEVQI